MTQTTYSPINSGWFTLMLQGLGTGNAELLSKQNTVEEVTILVMLSPTYPATSRNFMIIPIVPEETWTTASQNSNSTCSLTAPVVTTGSQTSSDYYYPVLLMC